MIKKILALFTLLFVAATVPVYAADTADLGTQKQILVSLGIVDEDSINNKFSNDMFINGLKNIVTDKSEASAEIFAQSYGLIETGERYNGSGSVTYEAAVKYMICALGYNDLYANDSQYLAAAQSAGLLDGVTYSRNKTLTNSDGVKILLNFTQARPLIKDYENSEKRISDKTALEEFRKIYKIRGIVTATPKASILSDSDAGINSIEIDEIKYECTFDAEQLLGMNTEGYIHIDNGEEKVLYLEKRANKNNEVTVTDENILNVDSSFKTFRYESDKSGTDSLRLSDNIRVIYNGRFYGDYTTADFKPKNGDIRLLDNNGDNIYEVVFISDYKTVVVNSIFAEDLKIYDKLKVDPTVSVVELKDDKYTVYMNGKTAKIEDINRDDVLSIAISKGTDPYITVYVSRNSIEGTIGTYKESSSEITIGGTSYKILSDALESFYTRNGSAKLKGEANAYLDINGRIAYLETKSPQKYFLFLRTFTLDGGDRYIIKCLDMNGTWREVEYNAKTKLNGIRSSNLETLNTTLSGLQPQVVRMDVSSKEVATNIETARTFEGSSDQYFTKTTFTSEYEPAYGAFRNFYRIEDENSALFVFPQNAEDKYNPEKYSVETPSTYFYTDHGDYSNVTVYDIDDFDYGRIFSLVDDDTPQIGGTMFIVTETGTAVDENDETVECVTVSLSGRDPIDLKVKSGKSIGVQKGDIVRLAINEDGLIDGCEMVCSASDTTRFAGSRNSGYGKLFGVGIVDKIESNRVRFKFETTVPTALRGSEEVRIYHTESNTVEVGSINDLQQNDRVVCRIVATRLYNVIIIRS